MKFDPKKHHRESTRMKGYDYSLAGAYFITLVTYQREMLFGGIENEEMKLNRRGEIVQEEWFRSADIRREIRLYPEEFVVMPNHVHGIVWIVETNKTVVANIAVGANGLCHEVVPFAPT
jgi:putative transposase